MIRQQYTERCPNLYLYTLFLILENGRFACLYETIELCKNLRKLKVNTFRSVVAPCFAREQPTCREERIHALKKEGGGNAFLRRSSLLLAPCHHVCVTPRARKQANIVRAYTSYRGGTRAQASQRQQEQGTPRSRKNAAVPPPF